MINDILPVLGISLGLTVFLEEVFAIIVGIQYSKDLVLVLLVNLLTNPAAVLCYYILAFYIEMNILVLKIPIELAAVIIEGLYYRKYASSIKKPFLFSVSANILSFGTGLILNAIF
jgi:hypothetical protein